MNKRFIIFICMLLVTLISAYFVPSVNINYDMTQYLPEDSKIKTAMQILEDEFGNHSLVEIQIDDIEPSEVIELSTSIESIEHIEKVIWLDDYVDLNTVPIVYIDEELLSNFYVDEHALLQVMIDLDAYDLTHESVISDIELKLQDYDYALRGDVIRNIENRTIANQETLKIMFLIVPVVIIILIFASSSWIEPIIILISLGFAIIMNMGTNALLTDVSFITQTMSLALQLALSLDYGLFLLHRYHEEKKKCDDVNIAIKTAFKRSFPSITASALTTIAGFLSLFFMSYTIGLDIGLVLSKGILLSYLTTMILMPVLIFYFHKLIDKTSHKNFIKPSKSYISKLYKIRYYLLTLFIILGVATFYFSRQTEYLYGSNTDFSENSQVTIDEAIINDTFGSYQQIVILVPNDEINKELLLVNDLMQIDHMLSVSTLVTTVDPNIPRDLIPSDIKAQFIGENYTQIIAKTSIVSENDDLFVFQDQLDQTISTYYADYHIVGEIQATDQIKTLITDDQLIITLTSVIAIFIILAITFKSIVIPIILVLLIETAIWMNLSILYVQDIKTIYIGYLVVMAIQLGATIDYAVLLTHRYKENRILRSPIDAMDQSYRHSFLTIMISALVLTLAGFTEGLFSGISSVKDIGYLLGKGTLISFLYIMIFLPILLIIFDKFLYRHKKKNAQ